MRKTSLLLQDRSDGVRSSSPTWVCAPSWAFRPATMFGSIPSSRCQTTRVRLTASDRATDAKIDVCGRTDEIPAGGARRDRTDDLLLAKQALSQLSYGPSRGSVIRNQWSGPKRKRFRLLISDYCRLKMVGLDRLERSTSPLSGVRSNHLSYRPEEHTPKPSASAGGAAPSERAASPVERGLVREERETETAVSRLIGL
jgi:hypothetical protein